MAKRKALSKKTRFEVFKRDSFRCQYCGGSAPDVLLVVDHITPVASGGDNEIINLITSCQPCNAGKGARKLDDNSTLEKQKAQLDELNERRSQLEMMVEWRKGLVSLDDAAVDAINEALSRKSHWVLSATGKQTVRRWLKKHSLADLLEALEISFDQYLEFGEDKKATDVSWNKSFSYIPRIAAVKKREVDKPYMGDLFYIRGILRNRLNFVDERLCLQLLEQAVEANASIDSLRSFAKSVRNWSSWKATMEEYLEDHGAPG